MLQANAKIQTISLVHVPVQVTARSQHHVKVLNIWHGKIPASIARLAQKIHVRLVIGTKSAPSSYLLCPFLSLFVQWLLFSEKGNKRLLTWNRHGSTRVYQRTKCWLSTTICIDSHIKL